MQLRDLLIPVITGAACLAAGWYLGGSSERQATPIAAAHNGGGLAAGQSAVDQVATDTHDCPQPGTVVGDAEPQAVPQSRMPTREQAAASMQAHAVLDAAIARRVWTDADAEAFTGYFEDLTPEEKIATLRKFTTAINQQAMKSQTDRMPF